MKKLFSILALVAAFTFVNFTFVDEAKAEPGVLLWGNWCGPGNADGYAPPIDPLDAACMRHDICYEVQHPGDCSCDIAFMNELKRMSYPTESVYVKARAMYDAIAMTPCDDPMGWAYKQSCMWKDMADDMMSGRSMPFEVPARWMYLFSDARPDW